MEEAKQTDPVVKSETATQQLALQEIKKSDDAKFTIASSTTLIDNNNVSMLNVQSQPPKVVIDPKQLESKVDHDEKNMDETISNSRNDQDQNQRTIGRWYIYETLGKGGHSWVKRGRDTKNGKHVALKFIDSKRIYDKFDDKTIEQIATETRILKNIKHSNIVRLFAYNMKAKYPERDKSTRDVIFLVMEYMSGGKLFDLLYYTNQQNGLSEILARTYFHQLVSGIETLHNKQIIHGGLNPQNLSTSISL